jgi:hypothetical protein
VLNDLKKLKVKTWSYLVKDRKAWYALAQETKIHQGIGGGGGGGSGSSSK